MSVLDPINPVSQGSTNIHAPKESKWVYFIPVANAVVGIYRVIKQLYTASKVNKALQELRWEDTKSMEIATEILGKLGKTSSYVKTDEFYQKSFELLSHKNGNTNLLNEGKVTKAFESVMKNDHIALINEWYNSQNWDGNYDRMGVLKKLKEKAIEAKRDNGFCPNYFYYSEMYKTLKEGEKQFANYLRPIQFINEQNRAYDQDVNHIQFESMKKYDISWTSTVNGSYELDTRIGNLLKKIRNTEHKIKQEPERKKIAIITCSYGGGHKTAAEAVKSYVDADTSIIDPSSDVLLTTQWFYHFGKLFGKDWKDPDIFNFILKKQWYKLDNYKRKIANFFYKIFKPNAFNGVISGSPNKDSLHKELLRKRFLREMPDQIVTVYHMALNPIVEVAQEMGIPVIHLATDYDCKGHEVYPNHTEVPQYDHFKFSAPIGNKRVTNTLPPLRENQRLVCGFPVRKEFFVKTSEDVLTGMREERNLDEDTKVLLIMGGGGGQKVPYPYQLAALENYEGKLHVIVIAGANKEFGDEIEALQAKNPNITFEVARGNNEKNPFFVNGKTVNELMDFADVILTKSGGASTAEALQKGLPILYDHRTELFPWEESNISFVKSLGRGRSIKTVDSFMSELTEALEMEKEDIEIPNASVEIPKILTKMDEAAKQDEPFYNRRKQYER